MEIVVIDRQEALARGRRGDMPLDEAVDFFARRVINAKEYEEIWLARWSALGKTRRRRT